MSRFFGSRWFGSRQYAARWFAGQPVVTTRDTGDAAIPWRGRLPRWHEDKPEPQHVAVVVALPALRLKVKPPRVEPGIPCVVALPGIRVELHQPCAVALPSIAIEFTLLRARRDDEDILALLQPVEALPDLAQHFAEDEEFLLQGILF